MKKKLILCSASPRRRELLSALGISYSLRAISCEETYPDTLLPENTAGYLAEKKALSAELTAADELILTADTIVVKDGQILGKPGDEEDALRMLNMLSGDTHTVYSAFCLKTNEGTEVHTDAAQVSMLPLTETEARHYIQTCNPLDKAGSYGIQDWLGLSKISRIEGSFYTVMGLPTHLLYESLRKYL